MLFSGDGAMTDLRTLGSDPRAKRPALIREVRSWELRLTATHDLHGFLWEDGGPIVDLNTAGFSPIECACSKRHWHQ